MHSHAVRGMRSPRLAVPTVAMVDDHPEWVTDGPVPIYLQVADWIGGLIVSGKLAPGAKLPAERDMAGDFGVAYDTVRRATLELRKRGLITTTVGRGTYVSQRPAGSG
jgi:GntR family transcriptional regulator